MTFQPLEWIRSYWISPREIRAEIWALGGRHQGEVLRGARLEARASGITVQRSILLKAVIRRTRGGLLGGAR